MGNLNTSPITGINSANYSPTTVRSVKFGLTVQMVATGYYGGANEKREVNRVTYYDWPNTWKIIRELQPNACIFSDIGPDIRWCGNESGFVNDSCWAPYTAIGRNGEKPAIGFFKEEVAPTGTINGEAWIPAEVDVSIRPGWFYHAKEDSKVRDMNSLKEIYFKSGGKWRRMEPEFAS